MKTIFYTLLLCSLFAASSAYAEDNNLQPAQATTWYGVDMNSEEWFKDEPPTFSSVTFRLEGDSIIGDTVYRILHGEGYRGLIRQSADGQQVYYRPGNKEYLLYDFSVKEGDTVYAYDGFIDTSCELERKGYEGDKDLSITPARKVLSVSTIDGRKHIRLKGELIGEVEWIEGIGTRNILFSQTMPCRTGYHSIWTLCAADSEGNILYSYDTADLGIQNDCPDWKEQALETTPADHPVATKVIRNGHLFIELENKTFTPQGQEVR